MRETITTIIAKCDLADCRAEFDPTHEPVVVTFVGGTWGKRGATATLDLCPEHREQFDADMKKWVLANTSGRKAEAAKKGALPSNQRAAIKAWAEEQGLKMPARGKVPRRIVEAYEADQANKRAGRRARGVA